MARQRNIQYFDAVIGGINYSIRCYTTDTRNGFCHTAQCNGYTDTKVSYMGRTWETFCYETCLSQFIKKLPKGLQDEARAILIDKKSKEESDRCNSEFNAFKKLHDGLSEENKKRLADSDIHMENDGDMKAVMGLMALMTICQ